MDAARLKRARWRLRAYFFGSGILMAAVFLCMAAFVMSWLGVEKTSYAATLVLAAAVLAGGTYGIIFFAGVLIHIARRVLKRQPIMEIED
jgi:nitrate reductase gamma subunit